MAISNSIILQTDNEQITIVKPLRSSLLDAPKLQSDGYEVARFMERKHREKMLEDGNSCFERLTR